MYWFPRWAVEVTMGAVTEDAMAMLIVTDELWELIEPLLPERPPAS